MVCLQMTNNSLTVKFHYLRCFEPLRLYRYRRLQVLSAPILYSHRNGHLSRVFHNFNDNLFIVFKYCLVPFGSISAVPYTGISSPLCTSGDLLWFLPMTLAQTTPPLSRKSLLLRKFPRESDQLQSNSCFSRSSISIALQQSDSKPLYKRETRGDRT